MSSATKEPQPEVPQRPLPRRGRGWVLLIGALALIALGYAVVSIATQKPNENTVHLEGIGQAQELFGGVPQEGARLGSEDAAVTVQVFGDEQSSLCREGFLSTIPELTEKYARPGSVKFLYRHYSNSENEIEYGFYGTEAAAEQGYGWQYLYLFYVNQEEAENFGVTEAENRRSGLRENFLDSLAGGVEELEDDEWEEAFDQGREPDSTMTTSLEAQQELGSKLGIRYGLAMVIEGPNGNETLQENPSLGAVEKAIEKVE
ncbi:MAG TPA: thioredoxin domain-containing protein [Solirubrobacterales bacterium]|nr:thioredoxin domain-containing protein [Solirubrobacterales bacterium]